MARRPTQQQVFAELLDQYGVQIAKAFAAAIDDLRSAAEVQRIITALKAGDVEAAIQALHLDPAAYNPLSDAINRAYSEGGTTAASYLPTMKDAAGATVIVRFDIRNPRAESWLRDQSSDLVTRILDDQRAAVRQRLTAGLERGDNPTTTALDIVGRLDRASGQRIGGILGLSTPQETYVATARQELTGGDAANYFTRARRDKRFDPTIRKAIEAGEPVPADTVRKAVAAYERRLLQLRGETIGRTESLTALRASKHEAFLQAVQKGGVDARTVRRTWQSAHDDRVRHTHQELNGETVGLYEPFTSPSGALLVFPGDTSLGAPASEIIGCRCDVSYRIDFLSNLG